MIFESLKMSPTKDPEPMEQEIHQKEEPIQEDEEEELEKVIRCQTPALFVAVSRASNFESMSSDY